VPDNLGQDAIAIAFGEEETVVALVRRPTIDTLANLWVSGRLDVRKVTDADFCSGSSTSIPR
jgi:hypothetical protein